jgi:two-component system phosphate regulon sensor histidine kinase PhoR
MSRRSITLNHLLWTWGFFLLVLSAVFVFATGRAERAVLAEAEERARRSLDLAQYLLRSHAVFAGNAALAAYVDGLGPHLGFRLSYIVDGRVVADSDVGAAGVGEMEDHADRAEVKKALEGGYGQDLRSSRTLGRDMLYVAQAFAGGPGLPAGIVRLALPVSSLRGEIGRVRETLLAVLALVFVAGGVASFVLARRMSRTVGELAAVAKDIGEGHFDRRIHLVPATDFAPLAEAINHLAGRIGAHVGEIEARQARQDAIFEGMAEGLAILDAAGRITAANRAFRDMFPKFADPVGRIPLETGAPLCVQRALGQPGDGPGSVRGVGRFELPNGRVTDVVEAVPVTPELGRILTFRDVTEAAAMERIFRDFVIDASHNLRTPLTKVLGYAETAGALVAADPPDTAAAASALAVVVRAAETMKTVIDDLLAAARDRFAAAKAKAPATDALAVLKQALASVGPVLGAKGVTARIVEAPPGPVAVAAPHDILVQTFSSLLVQTPDAASVAIRVLGGEDGVSVRFEGPVRLDAVLPGAELPGGKIFFDGATRVVRLVAA